ncbi:MAG: O-antigen ligase family protein [Nitrospirae bacterium]|nr:O-antigen ligase family protein [Nitrospirota bacterium]
MQKENLNAFESVLEKTLHISLFIYLFLIIFPHTTTLLEIAFWLAFSSWAVLRLKFRKHEPFIPLNQITISIFIFILIALIASLAGMDPIDNLKQFKGGLLIPLSLFLIIVTEYDNCEKIKELLIAPVSAFAIYTMLVVNESFIWGLSYYWDHFLEKYTVWLDGYTGKGITIFPLSLGYFLLIRTNLRFLLLIFIFLEFAIMVGVRDISCFGSIAFVILLGALFARPEIYRFWIRAFILTLLFSGAIVFYMHKDNPVMDEYKAKLYQITNLSDEIKTGGFSNRIPMWKAAVDIIKDRPLLGYGWGMKKYPKILAEEKYLNKWKTDKPEVYNLFAPLKGKYFLPPHNFFLEIAVQVGLLGLISGIAFIGIYLFQLIKISIRSNSDMERNFFIILIAGTILGFIIPNLMSDKLGGISVKILFVVLGAGMAKKE